jgi:dTDP-4-dehydrorhamnose reductase
MKFLIWGGNGWIGSMLGTLLRERGHEVIIARARLQNYESVGQELDLIKPDFVFNAAGITGRPTIDWCETNQQDTYLINSIGTANLADACWRRHIHLTYYGTGCIYTYDQTHPIEGPAFTELDQPNFKGSTYSRSKILAEELMAPYDNVLILRIRLPISADLHPKSLVTKLSRYPKIASIPNSITILPELLPWSLEMALSKLTGIVNLTNPGVVTHNQILTLYQKYVDPTLTWENFTEEEMYTILKSKRSNCELSAAKLASLFPVQPAIVSLEKLFQSIQDSAGTSSLESTLAL